MWLVGFSLLLISIACALFRGCIASILMCFKRLLSACSWNRLLPSVAIARVADRCQSCKIDHAPTDAELSRELDQVV